MKLAEGWQKTDLWRVAEVRSGLSKSERRQGPSVVRPYMRVANVQDGRLDLTEIKQIAVPAAQVERFTLAKDDILVVEGNGRPEYLGRCSVWDGSIPECVHQNHIFAVRVNDRNIVDSFFLAYQLQSAYGRNYFLGCAKGSTSLATLNAEQLKHFPLLYPNIKEQLRIVGYLRDVDLAIQCGTTLFSAKAERFRCLKRMLLTGEIRLNGFRAPWRRFRLKELLVERDERSSGAEQVYSVSVHKGLVNQVDHLGRSFAASDTSKYRVVMPGDVVYTKSPTGDFPFGIIKQSRLDHAVVVSPLYGVFAPRELGHGAFLDYYFESPVNANNYLKPIIQKGAKNTIAITNQTFLSNSVAIPTDVDEVKAILEFLGPVATELQLLQQTLELYGKQKRGLVQELVTGKRPSNCGKGAAV